MLLSLLPADLPLAFLEEALGPILLIVIWALRAIFSANAEAKQRRPQGPGGPDDDEPDDDEAIRSELEEFLRRVQGDQGPQPEPEPVAREAAMAEVAPAGERRIEVFEDEPEERPVRRQLDPFEEPVRRREKPPATVQDPEPVVLEPVTASTSVSSVEARHLPESQLAEHATHLGERIAGSDDRLQARLDAKFGKSMGTLDAERKQAEKSEASAGEPTPAQRVAEALASPTGVRDAVVLNEILRRPTDRWSS